MSYRSSTDHKKAKLEDIRRLTAYQLGDIFEYLRQPHADVSFVGLRSWLVNVAGLDPKNEKYTKFFDVLDSYIKLTELKSVQNSSEYTKMDLMLAGSLKKDKKEDRGPLFEI